MTDRRGIWSRLVSGITGGDDDTASRGPASDDSPGSETGGAYARAIVSRFTRKARTAPYYLDATAASKGAPAPLVIHLHGDGFQEFSHLEQRAPSSVAFRYLDVAHAHGAIALIPRTPDLDTGTWYEKGSSTKWLVALIREVLDSHDVDRSRIFLSGFSGGAEEITYNLIADHHDLLQGGGAMILGGGGAEDLSFTGRPSVDLLARFPMRWFVGEHDVAGATEPKSFSAREAADGGAAFCGSMGFTTSVAVIPGVAHNDSEPYGPHFLHEVMNESNRLGGRPAVAAPSGLARP